MKFNSEKETIRFNGKVTNVRKHVSPNDTSLDSNGMHALEIGGETYYWESHPNDSRTGATIDIPNEHGGLDPVPIQGAVVSGDAHIVVGRRGNEHRIIGSVDVVEVEDDE